MYRCVLVCALLVLFLAGCGSGVPAEASSSLQKVASALQSKDKAAIAAVVVPGQRKGALGVPAGIGITGTDKKVSEFTLDDLLSVEFFATVKAVKPNSDLQEMDDEKTARLGVDFEYGEGMSAVRSLILKKEGDSWLLDMKATLEWWEKMNGGSALAAVGAK